MSDAVVEGELEFDFRGAHDVERLDEQGVPMPRGMSLVDFVVEERGRLLLIEVKDPSQRRATAKERKSFARRMCGEELINETLVPKARDSYTFLHLMRRDGRPFVFVAVLGVANMPQDKALLVGFKDRLLKRIRQEARDPWKRQYVADCVVVTPDTWQTAFPQYPMVRRSGSRLP